MANISYKDLELLNRIKEKSETLSQVYEDIAQDEQTLKLKISNDDYDLNFEQEDLKDLSSEIIDLRKEMVKNLKIILGTCYEGIIGDVSFRKGKLYKVKRRYTMNLHEVIEKLYENKQEVYNKFSLTSKQNLLYILGMGKHISFDEYGSYQDDVEETRIYYYFEKPFKIVETDRMEHIYEVVGFYIDEYGIRFLEKNENGEDTIRLDLGKIICFEYKEQIEKMKEMLKNNLIEKKNQLIIYSEDIKSKFAKQLVYAGLVNESN